MNYHLRPHNIAPRFITLVVLLGLGAFAVRAADRYVSPPGGYGTNDTAGGYTNWLGAATNLQWAVNKAASGEKVWVTNGTYVLTNQITVTNAITVKGVNGRDVTIINGNYPTYTNRCFYILTNAVVDGFTISNGYVVTNSIGGGNGGGVYVSANGAYVQNCNITMNQVYNPMNDFYVNGGGIYVDKISYVFNCTIKSNTAISLKTDEGGGGGGGVLINNGAVVSNCVICTNQASSGGGVRMINSGTLVNSTICGNVAKTGAGGGVYSYATGSTIKNCSIISNYNANGGGAGVALEYSGTIEGCLLFGNNGQNALKNYYVTVRNCTVTKNTGNGVFSWAGGSYDNCIINYNTLPDLDVNRGGLGTTLSNCCWIRGNFWHSNSIYSSGNISNTPSFVNTNAGNYRLANNSPCINTGANRSWMTNAVDLDGHARIRYGTVDMGAYERINEGAVFVFH